MIYKALYMKSQDRATRTPLKTGAPSYSCYNTGDKSLMRKRPNCDYDKRNIFEVFCYVDIP
jgi:hypothetical protein